MLKLECLDRIYQKKYTGEDFRDDWMAFAGDDLVNDGARKIMVYSGVPNCAFYRTFIPCIELARKGYDVRVGNQTMKDDLEWAEVIIFQRIATPGIVHDVIEQKSKGKRIIFDIDDYVHEIPEGHPYKSYYDSSKFLECMDEICRVASMVTVSTDYLKWLYEKRYSTPISVLPNCVDLDLWQGAKRRKFGNREIAIGWAGGGSHYEDMRMIREDLVRLFAEDTRLVLVTAGYSGRDWKPYRDAFEGIPLERRIHLWDVDPRFMSSVLGFFDIGIAPLRDNDFNRAKSNVKVLEYSMSRIPAVVSNLDPYFRDSGFVKLVTGSWYEELKEWTNEFSRARCYDTGVQAREKVSEMYNIKKNIHLWEKACAV